MASDHMNVAALGRPFTLGMLYDARSDELIPGKTSHCLKTFIIVTVQQQFTRGLYYEAGFSLSRLTSGKTRAFRSYDAGSLFSGLDLHGNLC